MSDPTRTRPAADPHATATADDGSTVDRSAVARVAALADTFPATDRPAPPPASPPGFELGEPVGRGGMGVVFRARDLELNREVAVKLLQDKFAPGSASARRFVEEAHITAQLQHPGIPPVYRVGELPDGRPFLAMKLIQGQTLADMLKETGGSGGGGPPSQPSGSTNWLGVFEGICQAVGYAHAHGVIHRDLKPANVMVGAFGEVQVMDWGLAKLLPPSPLGGRGAGGEGEQLTDPDDPDQTAVRSAPAADRTQAGSVMGTPAFMAPEQAAGDLARIDRRTDVFGLGAVLCSLLTGQPPYVGDTAVSTHRMAARGDLTDCFARLNGCGAEPDLLALCQRCLSVEPDDRPADGRAVAAAVAGLRAAADERARRAEVERGKAEVASREQRKRQRVWRWAAAAVAAVLLAGVAGTTVGMVRAEERRVEADQARVREKDRADGEEKAKIAERDAKEAEATERTKAEKAYTKTADVLDAMVSEITGESLATQKTITPEQKKFLAEVLTYYREFAAAKGESEESRARTAKAAYRVGLIESQLGRREQGIAAFERALGEYAPLTAEFPLAPDYRAGSARSHINLGALLRDVGKRVEAGDQYRKGVTLFEPLAAEFPLASSYRADLATAYKNLGIVLKEFGKQDEAEHQFRKGVALLEGLVVDFPGVPDYRADLAAALGNLGMLLRGVGRRTEAEEQYQKGLAVLEKLVTEHPGVPDYRADVAGIRVNLGALFKDVGRSGEAERQLRLGLDLQRKLAADFPTTPDYRHHLAASHTSLGNLWADLGKGADASEQYRKGLDIQEKLAAEFPNVPDYRAELAKCYTNLGVLRAKTGRPAEAEEPFRRALAIWEKLTADYPNVPAYRATRAGVHNNLGLLLRTLGKGAEAEAEQREGLAQQETLVADFPDVPGYRLSLGGSYCNFGLLTRDSGRPADSLEWFGKAIDTLRPIHATDPRTLTTGQFLRNSHGGRAEAFDRLQRYAEAAADWDEAVEFSQTPERPLVRTFRANSKLRAGRVAEAVAEVAELRKLSGWDVVQLYGFACIYSVASGKIADKKAEYADAAMELLQKAVKAGYKNAAHMKKDADLDPLRGRDDFQKLLAELEAKFPPKREVLPAPRRE